MAWQYVRAGIDGGFWRHYQDLVRSKVVPYQWKALNDEIPGAPESHSVENFRIAAGLTKGEYDGMVFQDSDLYKWLEAAGGLLANAALDGTLPRSDEVRAWVKEAVELIAAAQRPDGYLNTYFIVKEPNRRWKNLQEAHELYCAGHLIEAGVAVFRAIGDRKILDVACRIADHIDRLFGPEKEKLHGYPGHEEVELALVRLYRTTGEKRYLALAKYFVDERGRQPHYFDREREDPAFFSVFGINDHAYSQSHLPVREQTDAVGHAVRAMYLYTAMADIALEAGDATLRDACTRLWNSVTSRHMYITGGIGSAARKESFTADYDLPNDTAYAETCAAIGLFRFSHRMALLENDARYADVMERTLYNGIISGLALDGQSYFYVNPLEVVPEVCDANPTYAHVKYRRQPWYGCACCPPNIARTLASLGEYVYHVDSDTLYADLFCEASVACRVNGKEVAFSQRTDYPWKGDVTFEYSGAERAEIELAVRVPGWCHAFELIVNGTRAENSGAVRKGYARVRRSWSQGDTVVLSLSMPVQRVRADRRVRADWRKVAIMRGPIVYCLEEQDNVGALHTVELPPSAELVTATRRDLFGGVVIVTAQGSSGDTMVDRAAGSEPLYSASANTPVRPCNLTFIPYFAWANRDPGAMTVWVCEAQTG